MSDPAATLAQVWGGLLVHLWQSSLILVPILCVWALHRRVSFPTRFVEALLWVGLIKLLLPQVVCRRLGTAVLDVAGSSGIGASPGDASLVWSVARVAQAMDTRVLAAPEGLEHAVGPHVAMALTVVHLAGASVLLATWIRSGRGLGRGGRTLEESPPAVRRRLRACLAGTRISPRWLRVVDRPTAPALFGLVRPRILVPERAVTALDPAQLRALLMHEQAHLLRGDTRRDLLIRIAGLLFYFYPLFWPLQRGLRETTELACDEHVVARGVRPREYAGALAASLLLALAPAGEAGIAWLGRRTPLKRRLERLHDPGRIAVMKPFHYLGLLAVLMLVLSVAFLQGGSPRAEAPASEDEASASAIPYDTPPTVSHTVGPDYPEDGLQDGIEGRIELIVVVRADGSLGEIEPAREIEGYPSFTEKSLAAVRAWTFGPATQNGKPVACKILIPIQFELDGADGADSKTGKGSESAEE